MICHYNSTQILVLDVETTGLSRSTDHITTMTWLYNGQWYSWVQGQDSSALVDHWSSSQCLCTYNGKCFDEAFVCKEFSLPRHHNHLDIRYLLAKSGLRGGLKLIASRTGFSEPDTLGKIDGWLAVELWSEAISGNTKALETLICYNALDVTRTAYLFNKMIGHIDVPEIPWKFDANWAVSWLESLPRTERAPFRDKLAIDKYSHYANLQPVNRDGEWQGSIICFTGKMTDASGNPITRKQAREIANAVGFAWVDEVTAGCTHLVAADGTFTTRKSRKARELGITTITPAEFWEMIQ